MKRVDATWVAAFLFALPVLSGCVEGPFERANPNDPRADYTMRIETSSTFVSSAQPRVALRVVLEPAGPATDVVWELRQAGYLTHLGDGVFERLPGASGGVEIWARLHGRIASTIIFRHQ